MVFGGIAGKPWRETAVGGLPEGQDAEHGPDRRGAIGARADECGATEVQRHEGRHGQGAVGFGHREAGQRLNFRANAGGEPVPMRQLVWSEESGLLGCSDCSWVFRPPRPPLDQSPEDMARGVSFATR